MKKVLSSVKVKVPFVYDGKLDFDTYDHWIYEVNTWAELHDVEDAMVVKIMVSSTCGKTSTPLTKHVAPQRKWTVKQAYNRLFDYCFPPDFKL
jgi:hypothetical protein